MQCPARLFLAGTSSEILGTEGSLPGQGEGPVAGIVLDAGRGALL
jgi:hypothetical protein